MFSLQLIPYDSVIYSRRYFGYRTTINTGKKNRKSFLRYFTVLSKIIIIIPLYHDNNKPRWKPWNDKAIDRNAGADAWYRGKLSIVTSKLFFEWMVTTVLSFTYRRKSNTFLNILNSYITNSNMILCQFFLC